MTLLVIITLFGLSLLAAWILFKFLQSSARVKRSDYQLGGAVAGFVVILSLLSVTYIQVDNKRNQDQLARNQMELTKLTRELADVQRQAESGKQCLTDAETEVIFSGTVSPSVDAANVILAIAAAQLEPDGRFAIKVRRIKPTDVPSIYVIGAAAHAPYTQVQEKDDPRNLRIIGSVQ